MKKLLVLFGFLLLVGIMNISDADASFFNMDETWPGYGYNNYGYNNYGYGGFGMGVNFYGGGYPYYGGYGRCDGYYGSYSYCPRDSYKDAYQNYQGYDLARTQLGNNNFINYASQSQMNTYNFASRGNPFAYGFASNAQDFYGSNSFYY
ncbi:MAG: hypothetical protein Q8Q42_01305 [Nanoarchaeota archaeon]|nr:hypothetical protein [Nanoarchaeota archaeon]